MCHCPTENVKLALTCGTLQGNVWISSLGETDIFINLFGNHRRDIEIIIGKSQKNYHLKLFLTFLLM